MIRKICLLAFCGRLLKGLVKGKISDRLASRCEALLVGFTRCIESQPFTLSRRVRCLLEPHAHSSVAGSSVAYKAKDNGRIQGGGEGAKCCAQNACRFSIQRLETPPLIVLQQ